MSGNVIENALNVGIAAGWGENLRDVSVTGNIVRQTGYEITVSVAQGAGSALIANNQISGARRGGIVGMEWSKAVTGDLARESPARYPQLSVSGNQAR